jgi:hypothetical protein
MLSSFSEKMATHSMKDINRATKNRFANKSNEEKRDHTTYLPYIQGITDHISRLLKKRGFHTIQRPLNKMRSRFKSTQDRQPRTKISCVYKIPCSCGKSKSAKRAVTSPLAFRNTSEIPDWRTAVRCSRTPYSNWTQHRLRQKSQPTSAPMVHSSSGKRLK